ncbi:MAG: hypothetical protein V1888_00570 [archaeon]
MKKRGKWFQKKIVIAVLVVLLIGTLSVALYNSRYFAEKREEEKAVKAEYQKCIEKTEIENKEDYCKYHINLGFATMTQNEKYCEDMPMEEMTEECLNEIKKIKEGTPPFPY